MRLADLNQLPRKRRQFAGQGVVAKAAPKPDKDVRTRHLRKSRCLDLFIRNFVFMIMNGLIEVSGGR